MIDNAVDGVITINSTGVIQTCNPAGQKLFGYREKDLIGDNISMLIPNSFTDGLYFAGFKVTTDNESRRILKALIILVKELNLTVIAEGVEIEDEKSILLNMGCEYAQGYLFTKPLLAEHVLKFTTSFAQKSHPEQLKNQAKNILAKIYETYDLLSSLLGYTELLLKEYECNDKLQALRNMLYKATKLKYFDELRALLASKVTEKNIFKLNSLLKNISIQEDKYIKQINQILLEIKDESFNNDGTYFFSRMLDIFQKLQVLIKISYMNN